MHKLGVIIPYRNRLSHLSELKKMLVYYLDNTDIDYEIIIVEQDDAKLFNRGMLLNVGFKYAKKMKCDYVIFHDIDMIPLELDYSYSDKPLHLATGFYNDKEIFDEYFGGITLFPIKDFEKINGFSNKYWGWGYEDNDLLLRCEKNNIKLKELKIKNVDSDDFSNLIKLNGVNSYIKSKNIFNFKNNYTFFITFYPNDIICDHTKKSDTYSILSIPGYDFTIFYNSFNRYGFCAFDNEKNALYVNSNIKTNYKTSICVVVNSKEKYISVYQDGKFIGKTKKYNNLYNYQKETLLYIGVGNPYRKNDEKYFKGNFYSFFVYDTILPQKYIKKFSNKYQKSKFDLNLKLHYDANKINNYNLIDLSNNNNNGELVNCEKKSEKIDKYKIIKIPYRRKSKIMELYHDNNGFFENEWKHQETRWNQLRFVNEVSKNDYLLYNDGLSDLKFNEHGKIREKKIMKVNVGF